MTFPILRTLMLIQAESFAAIGIETIEQRFLYVDVFEKIKNSVKYFFEISFEVLCNMLILIESKL